MIFWSILLARLWKLYKTCFNLAWCHYLLCRPKYHGILRGSNYPSPTCWWICLWFYHINCHSSGTPHSIPFYLAKLVPGNQNFLESVEPYCLSHFQRSSCSFVYYYYLVSCFSLSLFDQTEKYSWRSLHDRSLWFKNFLILNGNRFWSKVSNVRLFFYMWR